jgi:hypothetical protein
MTITPLKSYYLKGTDKISVSEDAAGNLGTVVLHIGDVTFNGSSDEDGFVQILTDYDLNNLPIGIYTPTLEGNKIDTIVGDSFVLTTVIPKSYNTIAQANAYFNSKLHNQPWPTLDVDKKQQCLNEANIILSRFNYLGRRKVSSQLFDFPRYGIFLDAVYLDSTSIPNGILIAECEIARALADGADPEREARSLHVTSRGFSSVRTTYDPSLTPEHLRYGVPSALAWSYLSTYLVRDANGGIKLHRVS